MIQIRIRVNTDFVTTIPGLLYIMAAGKMYKMTESTDYLGCFTQHMCKQKLHRLRSVHIKIVLYWLTNLRGLMHTETSTKTPILIIVFNVLPGIMTAEVLSLSICCDVFQRLRTRVKCAVETVAVSALPLTVMGRLFTCVRANPVPLASVTGQWVHCLSMFWSMIIYQTELCFIVTSVIKAVVLFIPG